MDPETEAGKKRGIEGIMMHIKSLPRRRTDTYGPTSGMCGARIGSIGRSPAPILPTVLESVVVDYLVCLGICTYCQNHQRQSNENSEAERFHHGTLFSCNFFDEESKRHPPLDHSISPQMVALR